MTLVFTNINNRLRSTQVLNVLMVLLLAGICWVAHFWQINTFGLYEDDYSFIGTPISTDINGVISLVINKWLTFSQGRSLGFSLAYILSFISFNIGGINGVYCCGYLIILSNTLLFYWLMWRLTRSMRAAGIGGLAFCLFPADTTATFLTHSLGLYACVTFFLLATHAYLSDRRWLAYLAITASLISYETCFPLFLVAPLLKNKWERRIANQLIKHAAILGIILSISIITRKLVSESRMVELNPLTAIGTAIWHTLAGPFISLGMYFYRPFYTLTNWRSELFVFVPICMILIWAILAKLASSNVNSSILTARDKIIPRSQLWVIGIIMLFLAYPLTIILKVTDIDGRASRVHLAAIIGGSILCALGGDRLLANARTNIQKRLVTIWLATIFALLVGFGSIVQNDYRIAWTKQQNFLTNIIKICPDLEEGTSIFVEQKDLHNPLQIAAYSWSMPTLLEYIYEFPNQWQVVPRIYPLYGNWQDRIENANLLPLSKITEWLAWLPKQHAGVVKTQNVIMLKMIDERLIRLDRLSLKNGGILKFKHRDSLAKLNFPTRPLYPLLIRSNSKK
ncbi:hypothetical protein [Chamaesiphon sp. VAR_48_metabat_135_sub]|uniref:hypothetical protein n=1 Tax=Chamaesiphon sp. VAR_48_metabat_135_sub TaxID=2964699 RepID=UPI00286A5EAC|nr:hypothetical protein [Chamaesiphon sp. VAR_48_metabat_135_sub]